MKVGIVGAGLVGATAGYAIVSRDLVSELVFVDLDTARAEGEAMDVSHATPFSHPARVTSGGYSDLSGSELVVIAAGVNQQQGETRMDLIDRNAAIFRDIVPRIVQHAPYAILLVATNPVDVLTHVAWKVSGLPKERVIGSGTTLDTARLRALVAARAVVSPKNVHGYVLGEHGDSEMIAWSSLTIGGLKLKDYMHSFGRVWNEDIEAEILQDVRRAAYEIIQRKGATYYGVASAISRVVEAVLGDEHSVLTVSMSNGEVAYSLPRILGRQGVMTTLEVKLDPDEYEALENSVSVIQEAIEGITLR